MTNAAEPEFFLRQYTGGNFPRAAWQSYLNRFDATALRQWANTMGVDSFVAGGGKVFPESKKGCAFAAPLGSTDQSLGSGYLHAPPLAGI